MDNCLVTAISVLNVSLSYGFMKSKVEVLKEVNLSISTGTVYGLLGPSGCGKTSLLNCIVGRIHPDNGSIKILGESLNSKKSKIPRPGLMPQEIALYEELSIAEILYYFGGLYLMKTRDIKNQITFFTDMLKLQHKNQLIKNLSAGEKRRVSFTVALIHKPSIIILDEPTVGVDPLLRETIWQYLKKVCINENATAIVTTHYIEEVFQANKIGFMMNGKIVIDEDPRLLLQRYNATSLTNVFLKVYKEYDTKEDRQILYPEQPIIRVCNTNKSNFFSHIIINPQRMNVLVKKNFIRMRRNLTLLIFEILMPIIISIAVCLIIDESRSIPVAVHNQDLYLGSVFLQHINTRDIKQIPVNNTEEGISLVVNGDAIAYMHIQKNFTNALIYLSKPSNNIPDSIRQSGCIHIRQDSTNPIVSLFFHQALQKALKQFADVTIGDAKRHPHIIFSLFSLDEPIYGDINRTYIKEFMFSGYPIQITNVLAIAVTCLTFITDNKKGLLGRDYVAGVTSLETIFSHFITQLSVIILQGALIILFSTQLFNVFSNGNLLIMFLLIISQGIQALFLGFLISGFCSEQRSAVLIAINIIKFSASFGGIFRSLEASPEFIKNFARLLPQTVPIDSMKWLVFRGGDLTFKPVWDGFLITIIWILLFSIISIIVLRFKIYR